MSGSRDNLYLSEIDTIIQAITDRTRAIVITQPGNPIGSFYRPEQLEVLVGICRDRNIWLISDEVYSLLLSPDDRSSPAAFDPDCSCVVTINSLSKSNRMTGWRMGWAVTPKPLADSLAELSMVMHYGMPPFITDAAITAITEDTATTEDIRLSMDERRAVAIEHLSQAQGIQLLDSGAGMFLVLDVTDSGLNAQDFALRLLEDESIATLPCTGFGSNCDHLLRLGLCVPTEQIAIACQQLARFTQSLRKS